MTLDTFLFIVGTIGGCGYWVMGVLSTTKLESKENLTPGMEWFPGIWSLSSREYSADGKSLCRIGNVVMVITILCWIAWAMIKNK